MNSKSWTRKENGTLISIQTTLPTYFKLQREHVNKMRFVLLLGMVKLKTMTTNTPASLPPLVTLPKLSGRGQPMLVSGLQRAVTTDRLQLISLPNMSHKAIWKENLRQMFYRRLQVRYLKLSTLERFSASSESEKSRTVKSSILHALN